MVYRRVILGKKLKYMQSTSDYPSALYPIKYSGVTISTGYGWKSKSRKKRKRLLEGKDALWESVKNWKNVQKGTPELIEHINKWIVTE